MYHIVFLQETWLAKQTLDKLTDISGNHFACGTAEQLADHMVGHSKFVEPKATLNDIYESKQKYHLAGCMFRLYLFELFECLHAILL